MAAKRKSESDKQTEERRQKVGHNNNIIVLLLVLIYIGNELHWIAVVKAVSVSKRELHESREENSTLPHILPHQLSRKDQTMSVCAAIDLCTEGQYNNFKCQIMIRHQATLLYLTLLVHRISGGFATRHVMV